LELRRALYLIMGLTSAACGDPEEAASNQPGSDAAVPQADAASLGEDDARVRTDASVTIVKRRNARVVSAPPAYALIKDRYRYEPKTNAKAQGLQLTSAPRGMVLSAGTVEWSPTADQVGKHRVVLQARDEAGDPIEQEFEIEVARSTLVAEGEVSSDTGGVVVAATPKTGRLFGAGVQVPARAVKSPTNISVSELDKAPTMPNAQGTMRAVRYGPSGLVFDAPARVSLPLPEGVVHSKSRLKAYVYNPAGRWERAQLLAVDLENGVMTAEAQHFSIYAAAQSDLDLTVSLSRAAEKSACEGALVGAATVSSPLSAIELSAVNNLSSALRMQVAGDAPSVQDLLRLPDFRGSLRAVQLFELMEKRAQAELPREQRMLVTTLHVPGDGSADITHSDALGNVLAAKHYAQPFLELADIEQRLRGAGTVVHFSSNAAAELGLAVRVHLAYYPGDASLDPVGVDELGLAAIDQAAAYGLSATAPADGDCDGLVDTFDATDDRLIAAIEAKPDAVISAFGGEPVLLSARVLRGELKASSWSVLDRLDATLEPVADSPNARSFRAATPGRYLVSYRAELADRTLEHLFAVDVQSQPLVNTPPECIPAKYVDSGRVGEPIGLTAIARDAESAASSLRIEFGMVSGSQQPQLMPALALTGSGNRALFAPMEPGKYVVGCRAFDGQAYGPIGSVELSVIAAFSNRAPELSLSPLSNSMNVGEMLSFNAWAKDADGDPLTFAWQVDGATAGTPETSGSQSRLRVSAAQGGVAKVLVSVTDGKSPPVHAVARLLVNDAPVGNVDADRDGWPAGQGALADCDDTNAAVHPTAKEVCGDRVDFDCDGSVRIEDCDYDDFTLAQGDCDDQNANRRPGAYEFCDGIDNDCNQVADDRYSVGKSCVQGMGECQATGTIECSADGLYTLCAADSKLPRPELCDRIDNDCDGTVDEDFVCGGPNDGGATSDGGTRADAGVPPDDAGALPDDAGVAPYDAAQPDAEYDGSTTSPDAGTYPDGGCVYAPEACDGIDNDCNGFVDDIHTSCGTSLPGRCAYGMTRCTAQGPVCDVPSYPEICNQTDDDCDGLVDEGVVCSCDPKAPEDCKNGLDDNCDGKVDAADTQCIQSCAPTAMEYCFDRIDNDCDGLIDAADYDCIGTCEYQGPEKCDDGVDNDCDGYVDWADSECNAPSIGESCVNPHGINIGEWNSAYLRGRTDDMDSSCYQGGADYVFRFDVREPGAYDVLYEGEEPHAWSIMRGYCSQQSRDLSELVCKDATSPYLDAGSYFLVIEGSADSGAFSVVVQPVPIGRK
jgi:hypothetical protein